MRSGKSEFKCIIPLFLRQNHNSHIFLVKGYASPNDPNLYDYWRQREQATAKTKLISIWQKIAKKQGYVCSVC